MFGADLSVGMGIDASTSLDGGLGLDPATALIQQHTMGAVALAVAGFESASLVPGAAPLSVMRQLMRRGSQAEAEGLDITFPCEVGETVLDAAERSGHELPFSCRGGGCIVCAGRLDEGDVEMDEQYVLDDDHIRDRFRLLCCTTVFECVLCLEYRQLNCTMVAAFDEVINVTLDLSTSVLRRNKSD